MIRTPAARTIALIAAVALPASALAPAAFAQNSPSATAPAAPASPSKPATPAAASPSKAATPVAATSPGLPKDAAMRMEQHNKQLHDELGITAEEQPQWDQFARVMQENAVQMTQALSDRGTKIETMNAADNMQSYAGLAQVHAANMQKAAAAFQTLYTALSPQQKQLADRVFRSRMETKAAKR